MPAFLIVLSLLALLLILAYATIIQFSLKKWNGLSDFLLPDDFEPNTFISVIIAARNEAPYIKACLHSLQQQDYPRSLFEVIVIDDHSEDNTAAVVAECATPNVRLLSLQDIITEDEVPVSYKKKAIELGISMSRGTIIATTDADCMVFPQWLKSICYAHERQGAELIAGPVLFHKEKNTLEHFQSLDFTGMMLLTAVGLSTGQWTLANGANLAYAKTLFERTGGFTGNEKLASGDDIFLVQKAIRADVKIVFTKVASANLTYAKPDWSGFFRQRLRWGTKNTRASLSSRLVMGVPFLLSCLILFSIPALPFHPLFFFSLFLVCLSAKSLTDYYLLRTASHFFGRQELMSYFFISELLHVFYLATVGLSSLFIQKYSWKGRTTQ